MQHKPALIWPIGKNDWKLGIRNGLISAMAAVLEPNGFKVGIELKGDDFRNQGPWVKEYFELVRWVLVGPVVWHPSKRVSENLGDPDQPLPEALRQCALQITRLNKRGIGVLFFTIHLRSKSGQEPPLDAGLERYASKLTPEEKLAETLAQVDPLCKTADLSEGRLSIENVDTAQFRGGGFHLPTFSEERSGTSVEELVWFRDRIEKITGRRIKITYDCEHDLGSWNVRARRRDLKAIEW